MEEIIRILMRRDGMTYEEAKQAFVDCKCEIEEAMYGTSCLDPEDVLASELGLEPDYIIHFI